MTMQTTEFPEITPEVVERVFDDLDEFVAKVKTAMAAGKLLACACGAILELPDEADGQQRVKSIGVMHGYTEDIVNVLADSMESLRESAELREQGGTPQ